MTGDLDHLQRLVIMRHAKAEPRGGSMADFDRALAQRGWRDAAEIAARLADLAMAPDIVLVSGARRTRETWEAIAGSFPNATAHVLDELYDAPATQLRAACRSVGAPGAAVMVIAHNPGVHDFARAMLQEAGGAHDPLARSLAGDMPTSGCAVFDLCAEAAPRLTAFFTPRSFG